MTFRHQLSNVSALASRLLLLLLSVVTADPCAEILAPIEPCTCANSILDCSAVESGAQLLAIPGLASGQSLGFDVIRISGNQQIEEIPAKAFGNHYATGLFQVTNNPQLSLIAGSAMNPPFSRPFLRRIAVTSNPLLASFPFEELRPGFQRLETLDLSSNGISEIPPSAFRGLSPALSSIGLGLNSIQSVGANAFSDLPAGLRVTLSNNQIGALTADSLAFSERPSSVALHQNPISSFAAGFANPLPEELLMINSAVTKLEQSTWEPLLVNYANNGQETERLLHFGGAPIACDCEMKWLFDRKDFQPFFQGFLRCSGSTNEQDELWLQDQAFAGCP